MQLPGQFRKCTLNDKTLTEAVASELFKMYTPPVAVPSRRIPAQPDEDFDLIVGEMVVRFIEKSDILKRIKQIDIQHKLDHGSFFLHDDIRAEIESIISD